MKTPKTNKALGRFITIKRETKGLTLREMSKITGIDFAVLARIEQGAFRMSLPNAIVFSDLFLFDMSEYSKRAIREKSGKLI